MDGDTYLYTNVDCSKDVLVRVRSAGSAPGSVLLCKMIYSDDPANPQAPDAAPEVSFTVSAARLQADVDLILQIKATNLTGGTTTVKLAALQGVKSLDGVVKSGADTQPIKKDASGDAAADADLADKTSVSHPIGFGCAGVKNK